MSSNFFLTNATGANKTKVPGHKRKYEGSQKGKPKIKKKFNVHSKGKGTESKNSRSKL